MRTLDKTLTMVAVLWAANVWAAEPTKLPKLVDLGADKCIPCKMMAPVFAQAAREQRTRLRFAKLDTDANPNVAQRYAIRSIPSLLLFKGGNEADRAVGALDPGRLRAWLSRHVA